MSNPTNKLVDIKILYDAKHNQYYIEARYKGDRKDGRYEFYYSVPIYVFTETLPHREIYGGLCRTSTINFGFGAICADTGLVIEEHLITPRVEKMTIADIEEELGYKIELVEEKEI